MDGPLINLPHLVQLDLKRWKKGEVDVPSLATRFYFAQVPADLLIKHEGQIPFSVNVAVNKLKEEGINFFSQKINFFSSDIWEKDLRDIQKSHEGPFNIIFSFYTTQAANKALKKNKHITDVPTPEKKIKIK